MCFRIVIVGQYIDRDRNVEYNGCGIIHRYRRVVRYYGHGDCGCITSVGRDSVVAYYIFKGLVSNEEAGRREVDVVIGGVQWRSIVVDHSGGTVIGSGGNGGQINVVIVRVIVIGQYINGEW